jgi:hypothetical protein
MYTVVRAVTGCHVVSASISIFQLLLVCSIPVLMPCDIEVCLLVGS